MKRKKLSGRIKRTLAGILAVGMVLTGTPVFDVEAANELPEQTQPGPEISMPENPVEEPDNKRNESGDTKPGSEDIDLGEEELDIGTDESGETKPGNGTGESGDIKPGDDDNDSGDDQPDDGDSGSSDENNPGDGQGAEELQPGTEEEETEPEEEKPSEDEYELNAVYHAQVSGNDISGNDLALYKEDEGEGKRVVGGYIELPEDRDVSVVDEFARIYDYEDEIAPLMSDALPSQYIPEKGTLPLTRSQSPFGSCWAHSAMALAEIDMMRNGGASSKVDYSELHLAYFSYNGAVNDPLDGLDGDSNTGVYNDDFPNFMERGGNLALAQNVLANWVGAADEKIAPYPKTEAELKPGLSKDIAFTDVAHLQNAFQINLQENPEIAKRMIQKYGGVGTSYCDATQFYNSKNNSYYCGTEYQTNHAVTIVGWDDSFSADKFGTKPEGDGAWLIRNSWNAGLDTDSRSRFTYFWMSYYDKTLAAGYAFDFEDAENYDHNYQYDGSMQTGAMVFGTNSMYAANVFTAKGSEMGEQLEAVGIVFWKAQTPYTVSIYKNPEGMTNPEDGELIEAATTTGTCGCEGIYTIPLKSSVSLAEGDTFSVVVQYGAPEKEPDMVYLPYEASISGWYRCETAAQEGQSFYKNGNWIDFGKEQNANFRIKAYTIDDNGGTEAPTKIELDDELKGEEGIEVGVGETYQAGCTVLPRRATNRTVSWESKQPLIATVDANGLITGRSPGMATITVTCNAAPSVQASFLVKVYSDSDLRSIQITGASRVTAGEAVTLQTVRSPSGVPAAAVQWSSSDESVLTVGNDGVVTGVAPGYATITAGIGEVTGTKEMSCEFPDFSYALSFSAEGATLTWPGGPSVKQYEIYRAEGENWTNPKFISTITVTEDGRDTDTYSYLDKYIEGDSKYLLYEVRAIVNYKKGDDIEEKTVSSGCYRWLMPGRYSITYHLDGGENNSLNPKFYLAGYSSNIYDPKRSGYDFAGWYFDEGLTQKLETSYLPSDTTGKLDLYAGWTPIVYRITYQLKGGTNAADQITTYTIETDTFTLRAPTKAGCRFDGWYTDFVFTEPITEVVKGSTGNLTLYAKWIEGGKKITYELGGGTNATENPSDYFSADGTVKLQNPTKKGYDFRGWYKESNYETRVYNLTSSLMVEDLTLYAKWDLHTYKVTYMDGWTHSNPTSYTIETENVTLQDGSKSGYRFAGWYTDSARKEPILEIKTNDCVDMAIYAKWEKIYSITYVLGGGVNAPDNPVSYVESDEITLGDPVKEGYIFKGWYMNAAYTKPISEIKGRSGNLVLYAKWQGEEALPITEIQIKRPTRTTYKTGEVLDISGGEVTCVSANIKDPVPMSEDMISGFDSSMPGICRVTVSFEGFSAYFETLIVAEPRLNAVRGQRLNELELPADSYGVYAWVDEAAVLDKEGICNVPVSFTPNDKDAFQRLDDLHAQITVAPAPADETSEYLVYRVVFDVQGHGTAPKVLSDIKAGSTIDEPEEPTAEGYNFAGWCKDAACTMDWIFDTDIVQSDITLYAKWLKKSTQTDSQFQLQEIEDVYYYTGKACKPAVNVYDGKTMLKAGRDYTVKYFNNINANAGGVWKKGSGQGADFNPSIPYVQIIGKGDYTDEVKVNFNIHPAVIADQNGRPAEKVVLKYTDQFATAKKVLKPFGSIKYSKAMKLNQDYTLTLAAVDVRDGSEKSVPPGKTFDNAAIPAEYKGEFMLTVTGTGNYAGSISKSVLVADKLHLMKNAKITLGKNQKNMELVGKSVELTPSTKDSADTFTVKFGKTVLTPGQDYEVSYLDQSNERVGKATLVITGVGDYSGTKTASFTVKGKAFTAGKVTVTGIEDKVYSGRAITQNDAVLVYNAGGTDEKKLKYGKDYTVSYAKNINMGTATMTFTGSKEEGFSGSFKKSFKITADSIDKVKRGDGWNAIVVEYSKEGAKPVSEIVLTNAGGIRLQNGKDYTLSYKNNNLVAKAADEKAPTIIVKGKGNYQGSFSIPFTITEADLRTKIRSGEITVKTTAVAYQQNKSGDYAYKPAVKLMEGKKVLRPGADYTVTYINNTQAEYERYIASVGTADASAAAPVPQVVIGVGSDNTYLISSVPDAEAGVKPNEIVFPLTIYRNKLTKANLRVNIPESECVYTGAQVRPRPEKMEVLYKDGNNWIRLTEDEYTVSYGANVKSGKKAGCLTISGIGTFYGGDVTVNFEIPKKAIKY